MTVALDHQARINLSVLVGMIECTTVAETRAAWRLMDKLMLTEAEKTEIEFTTAMVNGNEAPRWNPQKTLPPLEFDLSEREWRQIEKALGTARFLPGPMRGWLEPLIAKMPESEETNGHAPA